MGGGRQIKDSAARVVVAPQEVVYLKTTKYKREQVGSDVPGGDVFMVFNKVQVP
mgnify:CR=1 FL=1